MTQQNNVTDDPQLWIIYRLDACKRRVYCRIKSFSYWGKKPLSQKPICGAWSSAPENALKFSSLEAAQEAAEAVGEEINRPGCMVVTTMQEGVQKASGGFLRKKGISRYSTHVRKRRS